MGTRPLGHFRTSSSNKRIPSTARRAAPRLIRSVRGRATIGSAYGAAGSLVVVLLWVYYSAQILFFGAEFTKIWTRRRGAGAAPTEAAVPLTEEARAERGLARRRELRRGSAARRTTTLVMLGMMVSMLSGAVVSSAQAPTADEEHSFRFEFAETASHRRLAVEGSIYNGLPWHITDVRLQVDCVDGAGTVTSSSVGWVLGTVRAGARGYFYVPVASRAATYRVTVQSFKKIARETPQQAP